MRNFLHREKRGFLIILLVIFILLSTSFVIAGGGGGGGGGACTCPEYSNTDYMNGDAYARYKILDASGNVIVSEDEASRSDVSLMDSLIPSDPAFPNRVSFSLSPDEKNAVCSNSETSASISVRYKFNICDADNSCSSTLDSERVVNIPLTLPTWDTDQGYCMCSGNDWYGGYPNKDCCGDDNNDFGDGTGLYLCSYNPASDKGEWKESASNAKQTFTITDRTSSYAYEVVAATDGWYACDILGGTNLLKADSSEVHSYTGDGYGYWNHGSVLSSNVLGKTYILTGELKIDATRKAAGGQSRAFIWTGKTDDTWMQSSSRGSTSIDWEPFAIEFTPTDATAEFLSVGVYHYPNDINDGTSFVRNLKLHVKGGLHNNFYATTNTRGDSEVARIQVGSFTNYDYLCTLGGSVIERDPYVNNLATLQGGQEKWAQCVFELEDGNGYSKGNHVWTGDYINNITSAGQIYYCGDQNQWVADLDTITVYPNVFGCEAAAYYLEGTKLLDYGSTLSGCCGDGLVNHENDADENKYEFFNGDGSTKPERLIHFSGNQYYAAVGGCWNNHKVAHGQFLEDVIGARDGHKLMLNTQFHDGNAANPEIKFWTQFEDNEFGLVKGTDPAALDTRGLIISPGTNYVESKYYIPVTKGLDYVLTFDALGLEDSASDFKVSIISEDDTVADIEQTVNFDIATSEPDLEKIEFTAPDNLIKIRFSSGPERFMLISSDLQVKSGLIMNDNGTFYSCIDSYPMTDTLSTTADAVCAGHDYSNIPGNREFFCNYDGVFSEENMPILSNINSKISLGSVPGERVVAERTNLASTINLVTDSGFELLETSDVTGCRLADSLSGDSEPPQTKDALRKGFLGNDYYGTKYLDCASGSYSKTFTVEESGEHILSAWIKGDVSITLGSNTENFYSDEWTRVDMSSSLTQGENSISFSGGEIDDVQVEKSGMINGILQDYPSKYFYTERRTGCCDPNYCWSGMYCIPDSLQQPNPSSVWNSEILFPGEKGYACLNGDWVFTRKKFKWDDSPSSVGFCDNDDECFVSGVEGCISSGETRGEYMCEKGNWTSKTKYLATTLLDIAGNDDYTMICGEYEDVLVDVSYPVDYQYVRNILDGQSTCVGEGTDGSCTNNVCVLKYNDKVAFGVSLNQFVGEENAYNFIQLLEGFACNEEDIMSEPENVWSGFRKCGNSNKLWYDYDKMMLIYVPSGDNGVPKLTDLESGLYSQARSLIYDRTYDVVRRLMSFDPVPGPVIAESSPPQMTPENWEMFNRIGLFRDLYVAKSDNKEVFAVKEIKYNHDASRMATDRAPVETFIMTFKDNKNRDVCKTFHEFERSFTPPVLAGTNCTKQGDTYTLVARDVQGDVADRSSIAWNKFTGWLRFD
jgi:hypothetical protein